MKPVNNRIKFALLIVAKHTVVDDVLLLLLNLKALAMSFPKNCNGDWYEGVKRVLFTTTLFFFCVCVLIDFFSVVTLLVAFFRLPARNLRGSIQENSKQRTIPVMCLKL
mmetsp:Transcript_2525/g.2821  ORF Transcript_2525/g.2821 Transcript_2525/m.2821 type:complete len:109 (-) Transcript_2525:14-340(-)